MLMLLKKLFKKMMLLIYIVICFNIQIPCSYAQIYIFSGWGDYVRISEKNHEIIKRGKIWDALNPETKKIVLGDYDVKDVYSVIPDIHGNRIFFKIGVSQAEQYDGYLILRYKDLEFIHMLAGEIGPFIIDPEAKKIYFAPSSVYDNKNFKLLNKYDDIIYSLPSGYKGPLFEIETISSCFIDNNHLYTSRNVFDVTKNPPKRIRMDKLLNVASPERCEKGKVLFISKEGDHDTKLIIYDMKADEIKETMKVRGWRGLDFNEWRLSKDVKYIIRDEKESALINDDIRTVKPGKLQFYDIKSGSLKAELQLPVLENRGYKLLGFSNSGKLLFYSSSAKEKNELFIVDVAKQKLIDTIQLPFRPAGVVWP